MIYDHWPDEQIRRMVEDLVKGLQTVVITYGPNQTTNLCVDAEHVLLLFTTELLYLRAEISTIRKRQSAALTEED